MTKLFLSLLIAFILSGCQTQQPSEHSQRLKRAAVVRNCYGTYNAPPRLPNHRVDQDRLLAELRDIRANTYNWLIWHQPTDWGDLQEFLPKARAARLKVWVTVVPPSESPPQSKAFSEPFRADYIRWAHEIAKLSRTHENLVAWSIDDFGHNLTLFTPAYMEEILRVASDINPHLAFVPCIYFKQTTEKFAATYGPLLDGVLFPYRAESVGANLTDSSLVATEVDTLRKRFGSHIPIVLDIYATSHSRLGASSPSYVEEVLTAGKRHCDSVFIYCHQDPQRQPEKYDVLKRHLGLKARRLRD